jgi:DNA (cytosine-5)-methyltransferase 1
MMDEMAETEREMNRPIGIDLFAGAGGLSLGFEQAGFDMVAAVDIDPIHCAAHKFNFPQATTLCKSVIDLSGAELRRQSGLGSRDIDVVVGGAPCQGFSMMGKRALDDPRNQLIHHFVRLVLELEPKYFVFENVKGLTVGKHCQFLEEVIQAFQQGGYSVASDYQVLNAADFGVPQDRRRLFLFGARKDHSIPTYPTPTGRTTVREAIHDLPEAEDYPELWQRDWATVKYGRRALYAARLRCETIDPADFSHPRTFDSNVMTSALLTQHSALSRKRFAATEPDDVEPVSRFKKLSLDGLCNTLRAGTASDRGAFTSPRPIHPVASRVITVREAARLHSYPDWFRFHNTKWHGFRQIGNSVPPLLARAVGAQILRALGIQASRPIHSINLGDSSLLAFSMTEAATLFGVSRHVIAQRHRGHSTTTQLELPLAA